MVLVTAGMSIVRRRRSYDPEFKREAIRLVLEEGRLNRTDSNDARGTIIISIGMDSMQGGDDYDRLIERVDITL